MVSVPKLITSQQAAEILCFKSNRPIIEMAKNGELEASRRGKEYLIYADSVNEYIAANRVKPRKGIRQQKISLFDIPKALFIKRDHHGIAASGMRKMREFRCMQRGRIVVPMHMKS